MATARVERRLAAILAVDVVGYSRLMEKAEAGTFARRHAQSRRPRLYQPGDVGQARQALAPAGVRDAVT